MRVFTILAALLGLSLAAPSAAQVVYVGEAKVWIEASTCPAGWAATGETLAAEPDRYYVAIAPGLRRVLIDQDALNAAYTTSGSLNTAQRDQAVAANHASLQPGRGAQIACTWRPLGGQP